MWVCIVYNADIEQTFFISEPSSHMAENGRGGIYIGNGRHEICYWLKTERAFLILFTCLFIYLYFLMVYLIVSSSYNRNIVENLWQAMDINIKLRKSLKW
jgi:hypothetical protein